VEFIINRVELKLIFCSEKQLSNLFSVASKCKSLKILICMDEPLKTQQEQAERLGIQLFSLFEIEDLGKKHPSAPIPSKAVDIYTIMFTSGTTGDPKGVILTHGNLIAEIAGYSCHNSTVKLIDCNDIHISYLPLAHSIERACAYALIKYGARMGFYQGNINELFNDIALLRPTFLLGVPRVWSRLHDKVLLAVASDSFLKRQMFHLGYAMKRSALHRGKPSPFWDKILFSKTKARLGGRVRWIGSGSAPLQVDLAEFLKIVFCCDVLEGYGLTENASAATLCTLEENEFGHSGAPLACNEIKLVDVPEMSYSTKQSPPTGEILLRGYNIFKGYFKDPEKTKEVLDPDGWFHTGDIGRWNANGTLSIMDRKKNIFKLAQGEYVAVEYLENIYGGSSFVSQIWIYGCSFKRFLVSVIVPEREHLLSWARKNEINGDFNALCRNEAVKKALLEDLSRIARESKLHGFEVLKAVHLVAEPFTVENELVTPTFKLRRQNLLKVFQKEIDEMYEKIERFGR